MFPAKDNFIDRPHRSLPNFHQYSCCVHHKSIFHLGIACIHPKLIYAPQKQARRSLNWKLIKISPFMYLKMSILAERPINRRNLYANHGNPNFPFVPFTALRFLISAPYWTAIFSRLIECCSILIAFRWVDLFFAFIFSRSLFAFRKL